MKISRTRFESLLSLSSLDRRCSTISVLKIDFPQAFQFSRRRFPATLPLSLPSTRCAKENRNENRFFCRISPQYRCAPKTDQTFCDVGNKSRWIIQFLGAWKSFLSKDNREQCLARNFGENCARVVSERVSSVRVHKSIPKLLKAQPELLIKTQCQFRRQQKSESANEFLQLFMSYSHLWLERRQKAGLMSKNNW